MTKEVSERLARGADRLAGEAEGQLDTQIITKSRNKEKLAELKKIL